MDKATLLKSLRSLHKRMDTGHSKQVLGVLISQVNKAKRATNDPLSTRGQLMQSARKYIQKYEAGERTEDMHEYAHRLICDLLKDEEDFVVERDTKKQIERIVHGQVQNIVNLHPDYFTKKGREKVFNASLTKRLIGDIFAYMEKMANRQD